MSEFPRTTSGPENTQSKGEGGQVLQEEHHLLFSLNIIFVLKWRRICRARHMSRSAKTRNMLKCWLQNLIGRTIWEPQGVDWIEMS